jgi:2'-5' RNA ligase
LRTFIAIPLPQECHSVLLAMQSRMRAFQAEIRWTQISSIHLTLKFLGEIDRAHLPSLTDALRAGSTGPGFTLEVRGLGGFPNLNNPRVIWCGIQGEIGQLSALQLQIEKSCAGLGFAAEEREFHPHLTLGRVQGKRNLHPLLDYIRIGSELENKFVVDRFNIYESALTPRGAVYRILATIELN